VEIVEAEEEVVLDDDREIELDQPPLAKRVLVVDDDPEIRLLARRALEKRGYVTEVAEDGRDALQKVESMRPHLVLLDAMLPYVHGFEVCRRLKGDGRTRDIAVVMMTAIYRGWRFAQDAHESYGADDYLEKPFHLEDLQRRVEQALKGPESHSEGRQSARERCDAGVVALKARSWEPAQEAFQQALRADPFSACAHYGLAQALKGKGDLFSAMSEFERAVELRPGMFSALRTLAGLYLSKGFRRKAIETLERALRVAPDSPTQETLKRDLMQLLT
jgi:CheY-like chemotaxis protein